MHHRLYDSNKPQASLLYPDYVAVIYMMSKQDWPDPQQMGGTAGYVAHLTAPHDLLNYLCFGHLISSKRHAGFEVAYSPGAWLEKVAGPKLSFGYQNVAIEHRDKVRCFGDVTEELRKAVFG